MEFENPSDNRFANLFMGVLQEQIEIPNELPDEIGKFSAAQELKFIVRFRTALPMSRYVVRTAMKIPQCYYGPNVCADTRNLIFSIVSNRRELN